MKLRILENFCLPPWAWHSLILEAYSETDGGIDKCDVSILYNIKCVNIEGFA